MACLSFVEIEGVEGIRKIFYYAAPNTNIVRYKSAKLARRHEGNIKSATRAWGYRNQYCFKTQMKDDERNIRIAEVCSAEGSLPKTVELDM